MNGAATSSLLMVYGTGPHTMDVSDAPTPSVKETGAPYTRFANLLYLDLRLLGFSYATTGDLACESDDSKPDIVTTSDLVFATLEFLDARPTLRDNPVVFVGESSGGMWVSAATSMLDSAIDPGAAPIVPDLADEVPWLSERVRRHADLAFSGCGSAEERAAALESQFGAEVLIQPGLASLLVGPDGSLTGKLASEDPDLKVYFDSGSNRSMYDVRETPSDEALVDEQRSAAMQDPAALGEILGVPVEAVPRLGPKTGRGDAHRLPRSPGTPEVALTALLGVLSADDSYYAGGGSYCGGGHDINVLAWNAFERNVLRRRVFVTNARFDTVVYTKALPDALEADGWQVERPVTWDRDTVLHATNAAGSPVSLRVATYDAGHSVTMTQAVPFGEDVEAWLADGGFLPR